jgi:hypothetical protein
MSEKACYYTRDEYIEAVAKGNVNPNFDVRFKGWGKSRGSASTSGVCILYLRGKEVARYRAPDTPRRREWMEKQLKNIKNLEGEKYFLWQPS